MKNKLIALFAAVAIGCTPVAVLQYSAAQAMTPRNTMERQVKEVVKFCRAAYVRMKEGDFAFVQDVLDQMDQSSRTTVAAMCYAYTVGRGDGRQHMT